MNGQSMFLSKLQIGWDAAEKGQSTAAEKEGNAVAWITLSH